METSRRRAGGRRDKLLARSAGPTNPCPPGQRGGQYAPLSSKDIEAIYDTALRLLAQLGMGEVPERLHRDLLAAGGVDNGAGRVLFPRALVEDAIARAAKRFVLHGRDEARSIDVGGDSVHFGTGGAAVQTLDLESGLYRPSTLLDLHAFTRLQDTLAFDSICETVLGVGHFLGAQQTYAAMERDYFYPKLADRDTPVTWAKKGARDIWTRARERTRAILAEHNPEYLTPEQDTAIRAAFPIL